MPLTSTLEVTPPKLPGKTVDNEKPTVADGTLTVVDKTATEYAVTYTKATDNEPDSDLLYFLYLSDSANLDTITNVLNNGRLQNPGGTQDVAKLTTTEAITAESTRHHNVLVQDANGNKQIYTPGSTTTLAPSATGEDSRAGDEAFMQDFYDSTNGASWNDNTGWNDGAMSLDDSPIGLTVGDPGTGELRILEINMQSQTTNGAGQWTGNNLNGTLPASIGNLKYCTDLRLKSNLLTGNIPDELGYMTRLEWCALGGQRNDVDLQNSAWNEANHRGGPASGKEFEESNTFSGPIPSTIGNLTNLQLLEIRMQYLTGTIPPEIGNLTNLIGLFLNGSKADNPLGGELPVELGNLSSLKHFHLETPDGSIPDTDPTKGFTGQIPTEVINLSEVRHFRIRNQNFTGDFPILGTTDLRVIDTKNNNFNTGRFPIEYFQGDNPFLNNFIISNCSLSGDIPAGFQPATYNGEPWPYNSMSKFNLDGNAFTGPIPDWMQEMTGHQVFDLNGCSFEGDFPSLVLTSCDQLKVIMLADNNLSGPLPNVSWATGRLITLYANGNQFTGSIPPLWESLTNSSNRMLYFYVHDNLLEGVIPAWIANITGLDRLRAYENKLTPKDILPNRAAIEGAGINFTYLPQKPFGPEESVAVGAVIDRSSFDYAGNTYQWYRDADYDGAGTFSGSAVSGETGLTIDTGTHGTGGYQLQINHPDISGYTFESEIITVT